MVLVGPIMATTRLHLLRDLMGKFRYFVICRAWSQSYSLRQLSDTAVKRSHRTHKATYMTIAFALTKCGKCTAYIMLVNVDLENTPKSSYGRGQIN